MRRKSRAPEPLPRYLGRYDVASIPNPDPYYNVVRKHDARDGDPRGRAGRGVEPITLRRSGNYER